MDTNEPYRIRKRTILYTALIIWPVMLAAGLLIGSLWPEKQVTAEKTKTRLNISAQRAQEIDSAQAFLTQRSQTAWQTEGGISPVTDQAIERQLTDQVVESPAAENKSLAVQNSDPAKAAKPVATAAANDGTGVTRGSERREPVNQTDETVTQEAEAENNEPSYAVMQSSEPASIGEYKITFYCKCVKCCGKDDGITATGTVATSGRTVAVNPKVIPYGSKVIIGGHEYIAEDTGGFKGNVIDVFVDSHQEALNKGVQYKEVFVVTSE